MVLKVVLDTNIIIDILNQKEWALKYLLSIKQIFISTMSVVELFGLAGIGREEEQKIKNLIATFQIIPVTDEIAFTAAYLIRTRPNRKQRTDLIIAATAIVMKYALATKNTKDFKNITCLKLITEISH